WCHLKRTGGTAGHIVPVTRTARQIARLLQPSAAGPTDREVPARDRGGIEPRSRNGGPCAERLQPAVGRIADQHLGSIGFHGEPFAVAPAATLMEDQAHRIYTSLRDHEVHKRVGRSSSVVKAANK